MTQFDQAAPIAQDFIAAPNAPFSLADHPSHIALYDNKKAARRIIKDNAIVISELSHKLYANAHISLLIILQGMDSSGKDGTVKALFSRTPPLNLRVKSFKAPSHREASHDYLWRVHQAVSPKGKITIFNRSHYEDILVPRVKKFVSDDIITQRYRQINDFERHLTENNTIILKFMLNMSYETQKTRLTERLTIPRKRWKFNPGDLESRKLWPQFMQAYEVMIAQTSTDYAPWHIIPADDRATRGAIIGTIVRQKLEALNMDYPGSPYLYQDYADQLD